jgi:hypothetical protein
MHFAWDQGLVDDLPGWVTDITDPDELRAVLRHRAEVIFDRYPDLDMIDVINEPFETTGSTLVHNHFWQVLGPDYIDELFSIVEDVAPPTVRLIVNEGGVEYLPAKADALVALAAHLQAAGHRIDGVGFQTHLAMGEPNWDVLYGAMRRVGDLGLGAHITEIDVPTPPTTPDRDAVQSERYRRAAAVCLAVPTCTIFDVWGVSDDPSWYENAVGPDLDPLLFDADFEPKPSYFALRDALGAGRPTDPGPPAFLRDRHHDASGGSLRTTYPLACRATDAAQRSGYGELADVTALFLEGNPMALPVPATLDWSPATDERGRTTRRARLHLDLQAVADRYLAETARPAIGLGGHPDLVDTVWMRLAADRVAIAFADGGTVVDGAAATTLAIARTPGADTRHPAAPVDVDLRWVADLAGLGDGTVARLGPPTIAMDLRVELGVVFSGQDVSGTVTLPVTCAARGDLIDLPTEVRVASASTPPGATPVDGTAGYTG